MIDRSMSTIDHLIHVYTPCQGIIRVMMLTIVDLNRSRSWWAKSYLLRLWCFKAEYTCDVNSHLDNYHQVPVELNREWWDIWSSQVVKYPSGVVASTKYGNPVLYYYGLVVIDTTLVVQYRITVLRYLGTWLLQLCIIPGLALLLVDL